MKDERIEKIFMQQLRWYALADTQWDFGVLLPEVKEKTLRWIEKENCMLALQTFNAAAKKQRKSVLHDLQLTTSNTGSPWPR